MPIRSVVFAAIALIGLAAPPAAAQPTTQRIRGTIERVEADAMTVKTRDGPSVRIALAANLVVNGMAALPLSAITPGSFIGTATLAQADGSYKAIEVLVFPEAARGSNEGKFAWDLLPDSTMINATVATAAAAPQGRRLTLTHKGNTETVVVPEGAPVVTFAPGDRSLLMPGAAVFLAAQRAADGSLSVTRVTAAKDGVAPPM